MRDNSSALVALLLLLCAIPTLAGLAFAAAAASIGCSGFHAACAAAAFEPANGVEV
jgi:hypothetical protein